VVEDLYDAVLRDVAELIEVRRRVQRRFQEPRFVWSHRAYLGKVRRSGDQEGFLRGAQQQALLAEALAAEPDTAAKRRTLAAAPLLELARELRDEHRPDASALAQLRPLHATRVRVTAGSAPHPVLAAIVTASTFLASLVPKEAFQYLGIGGRYGLYRALVAGVTLVLLLYAMIWFAPAYATYRRRRTADAMVAEVIEHLLALPPPTGVRSSRARPSGSR
jgi:hypothetical protein